MGQTLFSDLLLAHMFVGNAPYQQSQFQEFSALILKTTNSKASVYIYIYQSQIQLNFLVDQLSPEQKSLL